MVASFRLGSHVLTKAFSTFKNTEIHFPKQVFEVYEDRRKNKQRQK